ncbi:hypothetical protein OG599_00980 [Streptomyces sp. NBC_01335]|uniref:hypothetical protein n=1 Tax=Streptomyces sp. NBC_01335 TaxID=2903828 RepID=UPI002E118F6C|nr:hypothetical protein OG599_00980 [Streptomyces sp. NBC_01335]
MPNSFSRFLNDEELNKVRDLYLKALQEVEQAEAEVEEPQEKPADSGNAQTTNEV